MRLFWRDESVQLGAMHLVIKASQEAATFFGSVALHAENTYNEYCRTLH